MTDKIKEIDELFSMFHDFEIVGLEMTSDILKMEILLPWSEMWNIEEYKITFLFSNCRNLNCIYYKRTSNELQKWEKGLCYPCDEYSTENIQEILQLELDIQSHDLQKIDFFTLHCNSSTSYGNQIGQIEFARIELSVSDYKIFDNENKEISLDKMKEWGTAWWDGIQKMWDDQKK